MSGFHTSRKNCAPGAAIEEADEEEGEQHEREPAALAGDEGDGHHDERVEGERGEHEAPPVLPVTR